MIKSLYIENIALIDQLSIEFGKGLNCLSGETGAGKSIIIDALQFVLGERADKSLIKHGQESASVEIVFEVDDHSRVLEVLDEYGYTPDTTIIITRRLAIEGKNECRLNGRNIAPSTLKEITIHLVDVFGQSQHLNLFKTDNHIKVLDGYKVSINNVLTDSSQYLVHMGTLNTQHRGIISQLKQFGGTEAERTRTLDMLKYQIDEINKAHLDEAEEIDLTNKKSRIANTAKIAQSLSDSLSHLNGDKGALSLLYQANNSLLSITRIDEQVNQLHDRLKQSQIEVDDIASSLDDLLNELDYQPSTVDYIEQRLDTYKLLKRKYGGSVENVLTFLCQAQEQYESLSNATEQIDKLNSQRVSIARQMYDTALLLSQHRRLCAQQLKKDVESQLADLGMKGATFDVSFSSQPSFEQYVDEVSSRGFDKTEFLLSANTGEPLKSLAKVISGGEMSRFMLAIKNITANIEQIPTMVFDEIDIGISGKVAQMLAIKLSNVSSNYQTIVVTHLPQVVAISDHNLLISKSVVSQRTVTNVQKLSRTGKEKEVARLAGGENLSEYSLLYASQMIDWADNIKNNSN
ncbi:MAG: DNA repair protein RecN [Clostridia bacterium]|nr:DNA repair protein RecN [Clostridia bacterium]